MKRVLLALAALVVLVVPAARSQAIAPNGGDSGTGKWYNVRCNADGSYDCDPGNCELFCCP